MKVRYLYLGATVALLGCATAGGKPGVPRNSSILTEQEIAAANVSSAYDAIERLRPLYLQSHGETSINTRGTQYASVYVDGVRYGDLSSLRNILASQVLEIRYYKGSEGAARFGLQNTGGVIEVRMK